MDSPKSEHRGRFRAYKWISDELSSDSDCMYRCNYPGCTYETNRSAHLKRHERIHTNERPYKCPFCDYCASRSDHLRRHCKIHGKTLGTSSRFSRSVNKNSLLARPVSVRRILPGPICVSSQSALDEGSMWDHVEVTCSSYSSSVYTKVQYGGYEGFCVVLLSRISCSLSYSSF